MCDAFLARIFITLNSTQQNTKYNPTLKDETKRKKMAKHN